jgi:hypothetical protein
MKAVFRFVPIVPSLAVLLFASGCGSSMSPTDASSSGATIRGTVNAGVSSAAAPGVTALSGSRKGIRVMVVGTDMQTTTDSQGRFVLQGLPDGSATLRFKGDGLDATLRIDGLAAGQVVTITVDLNGSRATLVDREDDEDEDEAEVTGRIESITPPSLRVSGRVVVTNSSTRIERDDDRIALTDLRLGERVEVEGSRQADGSILARKIEAEEEEDD